MLYASLPRLYDTVSESYPIAPDTGGDKQANFTGCKCAMDMHPSSCFTAPGKRVLREWIAGRDFLLVIPRQIW